MADTAALLEEFARAWNAHDVDGLVACMADDGEFHAAAGKPPGGDVHVGHDALRRAFTAIFDQFPDARWRDAVHSVVGDIALSEWTFTGTGPDGNAVRVRGCDVFRIQNGKIAVKDTFRKQVTVPAARDDLE